MGAWLAACSWNATGTVTIMVTIMETIAVPANPDSSRRSKRRDHRSATNLMRTSCTLLMPAGWRRR
ncbi:MAG TPA: hypothetical protein DCQ30_02470 [Acidimicrobiaceae bacterium]|nr:hypothetical protein [Acidimicrobiaceae bacterium]